MNKYFFICLACFLGLSCAKNGDDEFARSWTGDSFVAYTTEDLMSRTALYDNVKVKWIAGDEVAVYADGTGPVKFTTDTSGPSVEFSSQTSVSGSYFLLTYPFSSACGVQDGKPVVNLPQYQHAVIDSFDPEATVLVSSTNNMNSAVVFHNAHALIMFDVPLDLDDRIVEFAITAINGEPLAGMVSYNPTNGSVEPAGDVYSSVSLKAVPAFGKGRYYLAVYPGSLSRGFEVKAFLNDGSFYSRSLDYSYDLEAGHMYYIGFVAARKWKYTTTVCEITTVMGAKNGTTAPEAGVGLAAKLHYPQDIISSPDGSYYLTMRSPNNFGIWKMTMDYHFSKIVTSSEDSDLIASYPWAGKVAPDGRLYFAAKGDANDPNSVGKIMSCTSSGDVEIVPVFRDSGEPLGYKNAMKVDFDGDGNMFALFRHASNESFLVKIADNKVDKEWKLAGTYDTFTFTVDNRKIIVFGHNDVQQIDLNANEGPFRIAGTGTYHKSSKDYTDGYPGNPLSATVSVSEGCYCAPDGVIYFGDVYAYTLRAFRPDALGDYSRGTIVTICGLPYMDGFTDGTGNLARLKYPGGIAAAPDGFYVVDGTNVGIVRKLTFNTETVICTTEGEHDQYDGAEEVESIF